MSRAIYKTMQELIDAIEAMREFPRWSEKTSYTQTAREVVADACRVVSEQYPGGWGLNMVARVAKHMVRKNETASRAILAVC